MTTIIPYTLPVFQSPALTENQTSLLSIFIIGLLFFLLIEKEIFRAYGMETIRIWMNTFNTFAWALLSVFVYIILMRFLGFIYY